jgi:hypothetical protein
MFEGICVCISVTLWLRFCMQVGISKTAEENWMKLYTLIWEQKMRSPTKVHNSNLDFYKFMTFFKFKKENSTLSRLLLYYHSLRIVEQAVLWTALVISFRYVLYRLVSLLLSLNLEEIHCSTLYKDRGSVI